MSIPIIIFANGIILVSGCVGSRPDMPERRFHGDIVQMDNETLEEVRGVFETGDSQEIGEYCNQSMLSCGYYCRTINPEHEFCGQFNSTFRRFSK